MTTPLSTGQHPLPPRRSPLLTPLLIGLFLVLAAGGVVFVIYAMKQSPPAAQTQPAAPENKPALRPAAKVVGKADVTAVADDMIARYTEKEAEAKEAYTGKIVQVTGQIYGKLEDPFGGYVLTLGGGVQKFRGVRCTLAKENIGQFQDVEKGFTVTIVGRCDELSTHIEIRECAVTSATPAE